MQEPTAAAPHHRSDFPLLFDLDPASQFSTVRFADGQFDPTQLTQIAHSLRDFGKSQFCRPTVRGAPRVPVWFCLVLPGNGFARQHALSGGFHFDRPHRC
jgi:hypothetical protein